MNKQFSRQFVADGNFHSDHTVSKIIHKGLAGRKTLKILFKFCICFIKILFMNFSD